MVSKTRKLKKPSKESNNWVIAIPSYKRTEILKEKTLSVLKHYGIEPQRIYIFVADESDFASLRRPETCSWPFLYPKLFIIIKRESQGDTFP